MDGGLLGALADLVLPRTCAGCGVPGAVLCRRCAALLAGPRLAAPAPVPVGLPADGRRRRLQRAGAPGGERVQGAGPGRARPARWGRRWPSPSPPSSAAVPGAARPGAAGAGAELARRAARPRPGPRAGADRRARWPSCGRRGCRRPRPGCCAGAGGCATRPACRRPQRRANLAGTFERARGRPPPGGAAGARRRRRHQRRDAHRGGRRAVVGVPVRATPPVLAAVVAATPRRLAGGTSRGDLRVVRKRPENVPDRPLGRLSGPGVRD